MNNISDYDFRRISSFIDGELSYKEVVALVADMDSNTSLKETYFSLIELSEATSQIKNIGIKQKLKNISFRAILKSIFQRIILPGAVFTAGVLLSYSVIISVTETTNKPIEPTNLITQAISVSYTHLTLPTKA